MSQPTAHDELKSGESWEALQLDSLSIQPTHKSRETDTATDASKPQSTSSATPKAHEPQAKLEDLNSLDIPDHGLLHALLPENKERDTALVMEEQVLSFLADVSRDLLEFPSTCTTYQRMLAHKVAQHYGLHTSTSDYERGQCRVVAHRRNVAQPGVVRLSSLDISPGTALYEAGKNSSEFVVETTKPKLLRRPHSGGPGPQDAMRALNGPRTTKERQEEYETARARIFGHEGGATPLSARGGMSAGSGMQQGVAGRGGRGRGRGAAEMDPDYRRGRYAQQEPGQGQAMMMMPHGAMYPGYSEYPMGTMMTQGPGGTMVLAHMPYAAMGQHAMTGHSGGWQVQQQQQAEMQGYGQAGRGPGSGGLGKRSSSNSVGPASNGEQGQQTGMAHVRPPPPPPPGPGPNGNGVGIAGSPPGPNSGLSPMNSGNLAHPPPPPPSGSRGTPSGSASATPFSVGNNTGRGSSHIHNQNQTHSASHLVQLQQHGAGGGGVMAYAQGYAHPGGGAAGPGGMYPVAMQGMMPGGSLMASPGQQGMIGPGGYMTYPAAMGGAHQGNAMMGYPAMAGANMTPYQMQMAQVYPGMQAGMMGYGPHMAAQHGGQQGQGHAMGMMAGGYSAAGHPHAYGGYAMHGMEHGMEAAGMGMGMSYPPQGYMQMYTGGMPMYPMQMMGQGVPAGTHLSVANGRGGGSGGFRGGRGRGEGRGEGRGGPPGGVSPAALGPRAVPASEATLAARARGLVAEPASAGPPTSAPQQQVPVPA